MIADWDIFVVGEQGLVGAELRADVGGVMDADVKIGVVADRARQMHRRRRLRDEVRLDGFPLRIGGQKVAEQAAQGAGFVGAVAEPVIERRAQQGGEPAIVEQPGLTQPAKVEDPVADGNADAGIGIASGGASPGARRKSACREDAEGQVLDREVGMADGVVEPADAGGIVGFVDGHRGSCAFGKFAQARS